LCTCFISCKTGKIIGKKSYFPDRSIEEITEALYKRNVKYEWFNVKASAEFDSPQIGGSGSVTLRVKKDSIVWMVGKKFSIEGFRSLITTDSIYAINRLEHTYQAESIENLKKIFALNFNFSELQELLVGNILLPSEEKLEITQDSNEIIVKTTIKDIRIKYVLEKSTLLVINSSFTDRYGNTANVQFLDYRKHGKCQLPFTRNYSFTDTQLNSYLLNLEIKEIELNIEKSVIFNIPSHYERVRL
jgi:hypothetical protein